MECIPQEITIVEGAVMRGKGVLLTLAAAMALTAAYLEERLSETVRWMLVVCGLIALVYAALILVHWLRMAQARYEVVMSQARANTSEVLLAERRVEMLQVISRLEPDQIALIVHYGPVAEVLAGNVGALPGLVTGNGIIPYTFIDEFLEQCSDEYLCPVRRYTSGSRDQAYADMLTAWLVEFGYAIAFKGGPYPARWADESARERAERAMYGTRIVRGIPHPQPLS